MYSKFWPKGGLPGILHHYTESLVTFEYASSTGRQPHSLLFIGGLGDGMATTSYMSDLVRALQSTEWSLFTVNLTSSYQSWGLGHLDRDTTEIAQCVKYIKDYKTSKFGNGKVVLMGHSTGSQCVLHYLSRPNPHPSVPTFDSELENIKRFEIDGAIMQAPVSDRQAIALCMKYGFKGRSSSEIQDLWKTLEDMAKEAIHQEKSYDTLLPLWMTSSIYPSNTPISARRLLSLLSPGSPESPSEDDLFSSDLSDENFQKTFGMVQQRGLLKHKLMVLISGADQAVPDWVDKQGLLRRWEKATDHTGSQIWDQDHSAVVPGASHALSNDDQAEPRKFLVEKVLGYLQAAEKI